MISRAFLMLTLVLAGEIIFALPFHTARFYRPTLLDAFGLSNTQLGDVFAVYSVLAMIAYFPGGALADRFSARSLLTLSLLATGIGGFYMLTYPGFTGMALLCGYWGITTILLFWSALIRATREWGGHDAPGSAFGLLEGGRSIGDRGAGLDPRAATQACRRFECRPVRRGSCSSQTTASLGAGRHHHLRLLRFQRPL
jgi:sugar phosphate permease